MKVLSFSKKKKKKKALSSQDSKDVSGITLAQVGFKKRINCLMLLKSPELGWFLDRPSCILPSNHPISPLT